MKEEKPFFAAGETEVESIEAAGSTVSEAVDNALSRLGKRREEVDVSVLQEPSRKVLGFQQREARVRVTIRSNESTENIPEKKNAMHYLLNIYGEEVMEMLLDLYDEEEIENLSQSELEVLTTSLKVKRGDVVKGTIVRIDQDEIRVDIGLKSEGVLSTKDLPATGEGSFTTLHLHKVLNCYVTQPETSEGHAILSLTHIFGSGVYNGVISDYYEDQGMLVLVDSKHPGIIPLAELPNSGFGSFKDLFFHQYDNIDDIDDVGRKNGGEVRCVPVSVLPEKTPEIQRLTRSIKDKLSCEPMVLSVKRTLTHEPIEAYDLQRYGQYIKSGDFLVGKIRKKFSSRLLIDIGDRDNYAILPTTELPQGGFGSYDNLLVSDIIPLRILQSKYVKGRLVDIVVSLKQVLVNNNYTSPSAKQPVTLGEDNAVYSSLLTISSYLPTISELQNLHTLASIDPTAYLIKMRIIAEKLATIVLKKRNSPIPGTFEECIRNMQQRNIIGDRITSYLHTIRSIGNIASHPSKETLSQTDVKIVTLLLTTIVEELSEKQLL